MKVKITKNENEIRVSSPYNSEFVDAARNFSGKFDRSEKLWIFDSRLENEIRQKCLEIYGDIIEEKDDQFKLIDERKKSRSRVSFPLWPKS